MTSWRRPSKRSSRVAGPFGPSNAYGLVISVRGMRRRAAASASRARVSSFSLTRSSWSAACQSCGETTGGMFIPVLTPAPRKTERLLAPQEDPDAQDDADRRRHRPADAHAELGGDRARADVGEGPADAEEHA